jgi:hypothetical protein
MNYSSFLRLFEELVNLKELQRMMHNYSQSYNYDISKYLYEVSYPYFYDALNFIKSSWEDFQSHNAITFAIIYNNTL